MPNNVISEINPTGEVGGEYKLKDSVARGLFFESEDDYEEAVSQGLLNDLPDGTMIYTPSTGGGGGGGSTTVVEELSDIEAMTVFNGEAAGAKAVKTLKQAFSDALTALKNTAIAQAVGATGSTFTAVINKLAEIVNNGDTSKTITAGTSNKTSSIPAGYTSGGTITVKPTPSQTKTVTPSTSAQTISPDSGKLLSSVSISAISPQYTDTRRTATDGGNDGTPYIRMPYGWYPEYSATPGKSYVYLTDAIVSAAHAHGGTFGTITSNGTHDMGSYHNNRYVGVNVKNFLYYIWGYYGGNSGTSTGAVTASYTTDRYYSSLVIIAQTGCNRNDIRYPTINRTARWSGNAASNTNYSYIATSMWIFDDVQAGTNFVMSDNTPSFTTSFTVMMFTVS